MSQTREEIVEATARLFCSQGFNGTSVKQISTESEAPTGSIYHFFARGKDELGLAVAFVAGVNYREQLEAAISESTDVVDGIGAIFERAAVQLEESDYADFSPIGSIAREVASSHNLLRSAISDAFSGSIHALGMHLKLAGMPESKALELAATIVSGFEGAITLARTNRDTTALRTTGQHMQLLARAGLL